MAADRIARVAVEISLDREFDYLVPEAYLPHIDVGSQVRVPFGRSTARGYVLGFKGDSPVGDLKPIAKVLGTTPLIAPEVLRLAEWMAGYYASPIEQVLKTVLPGAVRKAGAGFSEQLFVSVTGWASEEERTAPLRRRAHTDASAPHSLSLSVKPRTF